LVEEFPTVLEKLPQILRADFLETNFINITRDQLTHGQKSVQLFYTGSNLVTVTGNLAIGRPITGMTKYITGLSDLTGDIVDITGR